VRYTRLYVDGTGCSHFDEVEIAFAASDFAPPAPPLDVSATIDAAGAQFVRFPAGWVGDWHPAPRRQLMVFLGGVIEAQTGDGEVRQFGAGSAVLVEDTTGRGHRSRVVGDEPVVAAVVRLAGDGWGGSPVRVNDDASAS
jgi:hypothetical protein